MVTTVSASFLLLLLPTAYAQTTDGILGVDSIRTHGDTSLAGELTAMSSYSQYGADGPWTMSASRVQVKEHYLDYGDDVPLIGVGGVPGESDIKTIENPESIHTLLHTGADFWIRPEATTVSFHEVDGSRITATKDLFEFPDRLGDDARWPTVDITDLVSITPDAMKGTVHLTGDIELLLWNTDLEVDEQTYWSGQGTEPFVKEEAAQNNAGTSRVQVLQVWLTDAAFDVPLADISEIKMALTSGSLSGTGSVEMSNPHDPVNDELLGESLNLQGDWRLNIGRVKDAVMVDGLDGESMQLDGHAYTLDQPQALNPQWWLLAIIPLATLILLIRPPAPVLLKQLEYKLNQRDYAGVAATPIKRLLHTKRSAAKAGLYRSTALLAMGAFQEAALFLASLTMDQRPDPATYHFLAAHAAAGIGSKDAARKHLQECFALAPSYRQEAHAIPVLQDILKAENGPDMNRFEFV